MKFKKFICLLLSFVFLFTSTVSVFASENEKSIKNEYLNQNNKIKLENGNYVTLDEFLEILENYNGEIYKLDNYNEYSDYITNFYSINGSLNNIKDILSVMVGTWYVPGVGKIIVTAGTIIVGGIIITEVSDYVANKVIDWLVNKSTQKEIEDAKNKIPNRLKDDNGEVDLDNFDVRLNGGARKEKGGWTIDKDKSGHKGSKWKLKDKSGKRVASLNEDGKVVGK